MKVYKITAEPLDTAGPPAGAIVVAKDPDEAMILLRKDINFLGYVLPPAEMVPMLGEDAAHEKGVYGFRLIGAPTPALPSNGATA
jgi:hypothetical protein